MDNTWKGIRKDKTKSPGYAGVMASLSISGQRSKEQRASLQIVGALLVPREGQWVCAVPQCTVRDPARWRTNI